MITEHFGIVVAAQDRAGAWSPVCAFAYGAKSEAEALIANWPWTFNTPHLFWASAFGVLKPYSEVFAA